MRKIINSNITPIVVGIVMILAMSWVAKPWASTRPDDEDGDYLKYLHYTKLAWNDTYQFDKLKIFFVEKRCPAEYILKTRYTHNVITYEDGPNDCKPIYVSREYTMWPAGCFLVIIDQILGLEQILYSHKCQVKIYPYIPEEEI